MQWRGRRGSGNVEDRRGLGRIGGRGTSLSGVGAVGAVISQGYAVPDSFTHGTPAQRMRWFRLGYETGDLSLGDTFSQPPLRLPRG